MGLFGRRTLIQAGFFSWCNSGLIFGLDMGGHHRGRRHACQIIRNFRAGACFIRMNWNKRSVFSGLLIVLALGTIIRMLWPDGLVTLNFTSAPLSKVVASIERQGRVRILTNMPPETPVTIIVTKVPLMEALETLSVRTESDLRAVFIGAADKSQVTAVIEDLKSGKPSGKLAVAWFPSMGMSFGTNVPDPRNLLVRFESGDKRDLQTALLQVAQKSGIMAAVPKDWNPEVSGMPKSSTAASMLRQLMKSSGSQMVEGFLLLNRGDGGRGEGGRSGGGWSSRPDRDGMNPAWIAQRADAMIAQLPPAEQPAAKADFESMHKIWEQVKDLPDDLKRAKLEEFFNRPEVQDRMAEREAARDARRSPEQREQRMKRYVERKKQAKEAAQKQ